LTQGGLYPPPTPKSPMCKQYRHSSTSRDSRTSGPRRAMTRGKLKGTR
jgi:hypothetical protein